MKYTIGLILWVTNQRFTKDHRYNNTWQYRILNTTGSNLVAYRIAHVTGLGDK